MKQSSVFRQEFNDSVLDEVRALSPEHAVAVEDAEEVNVGVALELGFDAVSVLILFVRRVRVVASLREDRVDQFEVGRWDMDCR